MYLYPGQDISQLDLQAKRSVVAAAAADVPFLEQLGRSKRSEITRAAAALPSVAGFKLHAAVLAILNHITARAAETGQYNEWELHRESVLKYERQPRPLFGALRTACLTGAANITVWTCGETRTGELQLKRAIFTLNGTNVKISEYWPTTDRQHCYPALQIYVLE